MNTYRVLGILWFALCGYSSALILWPLFGVATTSKLRTTPELVFGLLLAGILLTGAVASVFVYRGARWARKYVAAIAVFTVALHIVQMTVGHAFSAIGLAFTLFAVVSSFLLLLPSREGVA